LSPSPCFLRPRRLLSWTLALTFLLGTPTLAAAAESDDSGASSIVSSRAPKEKRPLLVRNKFFYKRGRFEITPRFGYVSNNALNSEMMLGAAFTYHFSDRLGIEVAGDYAFLGGTANTKQLAIAVLRLLDANFRLESVDPGAFVSVSAIWYPMYGKINPFSMAVINLDFFFVLGIGYGNETIEMLSYVTDGTSESAALATNDVNHLLQFNFGFGAKIFLTKWLSLRLDGRLYLTWDNVLNFDEESAAATNRNLGALANRLTCDDPTIEEKSCKIVFPTTVVLSAGVGFWMPGDKAARRKTRARQ